MNSRLSISQLQHFLLVAEAGSYRDAAAKAFRSQPALSKSIAALERRLGQKVFEPLDRGRLTPFGAACVPLATQTLVQHARAASAIEALARGELGSLRVAAIGALAMNWMPGITRRFLADHPSVSMTLFDDNSENIARMLLREDIDFGLGCVVEPDARIDFEPLAEDRYGLICHRSNPLAKRRTIAWRELDALPLIGTSLHRQLAGSPEAAHLASPVLQVANMLSLLALLEHDVGVTVLATLTVPRASRELAFVPLKAPVRARKIGLLKLAGRSLSPAAREFRARVLEHAATSPFRVGAKRRRPASTPSTST